MKFWDSSAITPLFIEEKDTQLRKKQFLENQNMTVWYGTTVEVESSFARRFLDGSLSQSKLQYIRDRLEVLADTWNVISPTAELRDRATRLLYIHPLRAADAFQLAAALTACREQPQGNGFLTGDVRLREAAFREGFLVDS